MYQIYSMDYPQSTSHRTYPTTKWIAAIVNSPSHNKVSSKKLNNENKHNLKQVINKIYPITPKSVYRIPF